MTFCLKSTILRRHADISTVQSILPPSKQVSAFERFTLIHWVCTVHFKYYNGQQIALLCTLFCDKCQNVYRISDTNFINYKFRAQYSIHQYNTVVDSWREWKKYMKIHQQVDRSIFTVFAVCDNDGVLDTRMHIITQLKQCYYSNGLRQGLF